MNNQRLDDLDSCGATNRSSNF